MRATLVLATAALVTPLQAQESADSLTLSEALALARRGSPLIQAADAGVQEAEARRSVAKSNRAPQITADALYVRFQDPPTFDLGPRIPSYSPIAENNYLLQLRVLQPLFTSGRISSGVRAAEWGAEAAEASSLEAEIELTADAAHAFDDVLLARALQGVAAQAVTVLEEAVRVAGEHYAAGTVARLDVLRAETRLSSARAALRAQETALVGARERLAAVLGIEPHRLPQLVGTLDAVPVTLALDSLIARVQRQRPDVRALNATAQAFEARADGQRASRLPALSAYLSLLGTRPELVTGDRQFALELVGGFSFTLPVFDAGRSGGGARAFDAAAAGAMARAEAVVDRAVAAVRTNAIELERATEDIRAGEENVERSEQALAIAQERYLDGIGIQLEVLEAEADLTQARADLLRAFHAFRSAVIELKRAVGLPADADTTALGPEGER